jgi:RNA polymerase sigma factor (TIGR02999 family)
VKSVSVDEATRIAIDLAAGNRARAGELLESAYQQLRGLAAFRLRAEPADVAIQPTELVHEAYMRMVRQDEVDYAGRTHFVALASEAMRRILVDDARKRKAIKRGGGRARVTVHESALADPNDGGVDVLALDEALSRLARLDERQARVVELRFFGGLSIEDVSLVLGVARSTVTEDWRMARAWLRAELSGADGATTG